MAAAATTCSRGLGLRATNRTHPRSAQRCGARLTASDRRPLTWRCRNLVAESGTVDVARRPRPKPGQRPCVWDEICRSRRWPSEPQLAGLAPVQERDRGEIARARPVAARARRRHRQTLCSCTERSHVLHMTGGQRAIISSITALNERPDYVLCVGALFNDAGGVGQAAHGVRPRLAWVRKGRGRGGCLLDQERPLTVSGISG
jgi:hypothetical protein